MNEQLHWHDDDEFWLAFRPYMFDEDRWLAASQNIEQIVSLLEIEEGARVLDLGCGPGRHSLELARRGFDVVGVDRTAAFLDEARGKSEADELDVEWILADMRAFSRPESFDLCLSLFTSFGYFEDPADNLLVLKNACDSLIQGGLLVVELMGKEILARIFKERDWYQAGDAFVLQERKPIADWQRVWNRWVLITGEERREFDVTHWIYSASELTNMLLQSGFREIQIFGDLSGSPYDHQADRLVAVARK